MVRCVCEVVEDGENGTESNVLVMVSFTGRRAREGGKEEGKRECVRSKGEKGKEELSWDGRKSVCKGAQRGKHSPMFALAVDTETPRWARQEALPTPSVY